jgi:hypothetical protein
MEGFAVKATLTVLLPLALLVPLAPMSFAGPPERPSGRMVLDEVADGLRRYRAEKDDGRRVAWLEKLAPARDPRVALLIWEYPPDELTPSQYIGLRRLLVRYYDPCGGNLTAWWRANEADLRRRARQLPR